MPAIPWSTVVRLALVGTILVAAGTLLDVRSKGNALGLVQPGATGPSAEVIEADFPSVALPGGLGHDGQQFYAIARSPMHLDEVAEHLDRPRYRLQRPLLPVLAWALHPFGGGYGLVAALFAVGCGALVLLGVVAGGLSAQFGGGVWPAALAPLLPLGYASLRLTLADALAVALAFAAVLALERRRLVLALVAGVGAALAKEALLVVVVAHGVVSAWRSRSWRLVLPSLGAAAVAVGWWVSLRFLIDVDSPQVVEFTYPFGGVAASIGDWLSGKDWIAGATVVGSFVLAGIALWRRGLDHPLAPVLAAATAFSALLGPDVLGLDFNGPRTIGPVLLLAILVLGTPSSGSPRRVLPSSAA